MRDGWHSKRCNSLRSNVWLRTSFRVGARQLPKRYHRFAQIQYADCSQGWMKNGKVIADLMPDYLHPSGPGVHGLGALVAS